MHKKRTDHHLCGSFKLAGPRNFPAFPPTHTHTLLLYVPHSPALYNSPAKQQLVYCIIGSAEPSIPSDSDELSHSLEKKKARWFLGKNNILFGCCWECFGSCVCVCVHRTFPLLAQHTEFPPYWQRLLATLRVQSSCKGQFGIWKCPGN